MELSSKRIIDLIIRYLTENSKSLLKVVATVSAAILIVNILAHIKARQFDYEVVIPLSYIFMYIGGAYFTSIIFKEMLSPARSYRFLTLPASNIEKLIFAWILTSPVVLLVTYISIYLIIWLSLAFLVPVLNIRYEMIDLFEMAEFGKIATIYIIIQPFFLLGAVSFKRLNFINTLLFLILSGIIIALFTILIVYIMFPWSFVKNNLEKSFFNVPTIVYFFTDQFVPVIKFLFHYAMAPFVIVIAYFKLKEKVIS